MELTDSESRHLFEVLGATTQSVKDLEGQFKEHKVDHKELKEEIKALNGCPFKEDIEECKKEIGVTKGERKYIYGLITLLYTTIVAVFLKLFKLF